MKTLESVKQNQESETAQSVTSLEFGDVLVYNEMADHTSIKLNLIEQIHSQLNQLEEMNHRRQFLLKEIIDIIK